MSKHTPGPWILDAKCKGDIYRNVMADSSYPFPIAKIALSGNEAESEANAKIIACAPELLDIAEFYLKAFLKGAIANTQGADSFDFAGWMAAKFQTIVAKATGEDQ